MSIASELFRHYVDYLTAPGLLLTLCLLIAPLCYGFYDESKPTKPWGNSESVPRCRRLGMSNGKDTLATFLKPRIPQASQQGQKPRVKALFTYPISTCKGISLPASELDEVGLRYDSSFTFAQLYSAQPLPEDTSKPSTKWQHQWRPVNADTHPRLNLLDLELWIPNPRQTPSSSIRSNGHAKTSSWDMHRPRSRSRQGTLVMESAGQEAEKRRKLSVPVAESDLAANGGCLVVKFPFEPDFNPFGLYTKTVEIKIPLVPTDERAEGKGYRVEEIVDGTVTSYATNVSSEMDEASMAKLKYFLGVSKPLALFHKDSSDPVHHLQETTANERPQADRSPGNSVRMLNLDTLPSSRTPSNDSRPDPSEFRPNVLLENLSVSAETHWQRIAFGRCVPPRGTLPGRGRTVAAGLSGRAEYLVDQPPASEQSTPGLVEARPLFDYGIVRVGDKVEVLESAQK